MISKPDSTEKKSRLAAASSTHLSIPHDPVNEMHVLGLVAGDAALIDRYSRILIPDHFFARENRAAWEAITETRRRKLHPTQAAFEIVANRAIADHIEMCVNSARGSQHNLEWHVGVQMWDSARLRAASGPLPEFLKAIRDPRMDPDRVQALARALSGALDGHKDRKYLRAPDEVVRRQMAEIQARKKGMALYSYGLDGLDFFELERGEDVARPRMVPGSKPGQVTVVTALSGGGKSTGTLNMVLGMRRQGRKTLYGAWEMNSGITLELLACIELGWSRSEMAMGVGDMAGREGEIKLEETMHALSEDVRFLDNPFRRTKSTSVRPSNERNLDILQGYIEDSGCDVFVGDLWKRCLVDTRPEAEEEALNRQQAMAEETKVHCILLAQQTLKVVEGIDRKNARPSRETIKGSAAYVEIADTIIGWHRSALFDPDEDDDKIEAMILKQRYGKWPYAVEFDWNSDRGSITGGRTIKVARAGQGTNEEDPDGFVSGNTSKWGGVAKFAGKKSEKRK